MAPCPPLLRALLSTKQHLSPGAEWTQRGGAVWGERGLGVQCVQGWTFQGQYQYSADSEQMGPFQVIARATRESLCGWRLEVGVSGAVWSERSLSRGHIGASYKISKDLPVLSSDAGSLCVAALPWLLC